MPRIQLMGEVALFVEGEAIQLRSTKELGLLAILAEAHPRPITRNYLLELLWPESEPDRARRSLNQAVYAIRQVVGQDALRPQLDLLALAGPEWTCDLWELDDLVAEAARTKTPLGRFARGGRLPRTELFRDWAERAGARVDAYLVSAYCAELGKLMDRGRFEAVEPIARAVLQIDPYAETGLYHLALAIARSGRITAGLQELGKARERFRKDLDRDLPAAFDALEERLRSAEVFEASRRPKGGRDAIVFPFVGREEEFAHLRSAWEGIAETGRRIVLVSGEPGIGKTRLVDRLARLASIEGGRVLQAECFAAHKRVAFAAISEVLRGLRPEEIAGLDSIWRRVLFSSFALQAVGTDLKPPPRLDPEAEQLRLFESATLAVQAAAAKRPVLVVVDDLQWLDQSSAAVLQHMIRRCEDDPVLFVLAARERELRVDDELRQFIANNRGAAFADIELGVLAPDSSNELIEACLGLVSVEDGLGWTVAEVACGHPFLITELTQAAHCLSRTSAQLREPNSVRLPPNLDRFITDRVTSLTARARDAAFVLAVWNDAVPVRSLSRFLDWSIDDFSAALNELSRHRIVRIYDNNIVIRHTLYSDWIYNDVSLPKRHDCHRKIAAFLDRHSKPNRGLIAQHYHACGEETLARTEAIAAASDLEASGAVREAEYFLQLAFELSANSDERAMAQSYLAQHLFRHSDPDRGLALYEDLSKYPNGSAVGIDADLQARLMAIELSYRRSLQEAGGLIDSALEIAADAMHHAYWRLAVDAASTASRMLWRDWDPLRAELVTTAVEGLLPRLQTDHRLFGEATQAAMLIDIGRGRFAGACRKLEMLRSAGHDRAMDPGGRARLSQVAGMLAWHSGDLRHAEREWLDALNETRKWGALSLMTSAMINLAVIYHYRNRTKESTELLNEAKSQAQRYRLDGEEEFVDANLVLIDYESGHFDEARLKVEGVTTRSGDRLSAAGQVALAISGLLALEVGDVEAAEASLRRCCADRANEHDPSYLLRLGGLLATDVDDLRLAYELAVQTDRAQLPGRVCVWKVELETAEIEARLGLMDTARHRVVEVEQSAEQGGAARIVARARGFLARFEQQGRSTPGR